jgi:ornithine cyclodeaminase
MQQLNLTYINGPDITRLDLSNDEILDAVESALHAQGTGQTVIEPRVHLVPESSDKGHFNVLRGVIHPLGVAGVKVVGDFVDNYKKDLPSELAVLTLFCPETGVPKAIIDASAITDMRTGAMTALGAKYLAGKNSQILGHIGARGTAYWNVRLLNHLFPLNEIRVHSRRPESRNAFAEQLQQDLERDITITDNWQDCIKGADIMVEASRLPEPHPHLKTEWIKPGSFIVPYGTMSAVEFSLTDIMDKIVVDDWGQCAPGKPFGSLRRHVDEGKVTQESIHGELGQIVCGDIVGRESDTETNLFWHRGLSTSDIALGCAILNKAQSLGIGQQLRFR